MVVPLINDQTIIKNTLKNLKAKHLREILTSSSVSSKGLFDRKDLEDAVIKVESEWFNRARTNTLRTPMFVTRHGTPPKEYTAVNIVIRGQTARFLIDSGSSVNLIKADAATRLGLINPSTGDRRGLSSQCVGGVGTTPTADSLLQEVGQLVDMDRGAKLDLGLTFILMQSLPTDTCGILGINFLDSFQQACRFDYKNMRFESGQLANLLSPVTKWKSHKVQLSRIYSNLRTCEVHVSSPTAPNGVKMPALVDLGAALTVANSAAAAVLSSSVAQLRRSPTIIAGIDGRPIEVNYYYWKKSLLLFIK